MQFREAIEKAIKKIVGEDVRLEVPPSSTLGDFAYPCFTLAKKQKIAPAQAANDLQNKLELDFVERVEVKGPYLNFFIKKDKLIEQTLKEIFKQKKKYGTHTQKKKKTVLVEYSSPNTNKPLHVGHLLNGTIGMATSNLLTSTGHKVIRANLINDRGIHISKSMLAYQKWGKEQKPKIKSDHFVGEWYVMFNKRKTEKLEKEAQELLLKWESNDKVTRTLWEKMNNWVIDGIKETYTEFGSKFDVWYFESEFYDKANVLVKEGLDKGIFKKDKEGTIIAELEEHKIPDKVVMRGDGTSLYLTQDLWLTKNKFDRFKLDKAIWVVGSEQNTYLRQLFKIMELLGYSWAKDGCVHLQHGMVLIEGGKMKSREGKVVDGDDLIEKMRLLAEQETKKRNPKLKAKELYLRAKKISLAAIKFYFLRTEASKNIMFDVERSVAFEGETGPYLQYSYARAHSILKKAAFRSKIDYLLLVEEEAFTLVKKLSIYPDIVLDAGMNLKPHVLANYLIELAQSFNNYYHKEKVIQEDKELQRARVQLVAAFKQVMENGLALLDIEVMDEM